ncbi:hypothetical protein GON26_00460 [Flavobacterium sp. GA093]|uniref:Uncharacterized protein n=1 Tax=Flavobacterium hydrocarbonoxydans TaxID=2683249 RepID=A0A6I4NP07_9FLAO|nr:DUF6252 family protein [Flavobacterium hydrocarbonoxydans]MWB92827.1 hypothetical protein [Flavobacterium hydrocarbonoxydans]
MLLLLGACDKDDSSKTPLEQLPALTSVGANTAGCLVNGEALLPKGAGTNKLFCQYNDQNDFSVAISEKINDQIRTVNVASLNQKLEVNKVYQLKECGDDSKYGEYIIIYPDFNHVDYGTNSTITGELKITNHNIDKATISGTFWFDAVNKSGDKIQVREGRFDMEY